MGTGNDAEVSKTGIPTSPRREGSRRKQDYQNLGWVAGGSKDRASCLPGAGVPKKTQWLQGMPGETQRWGHTPASLSFPPAGASHQPRPTGVQLPRSLRNQKIATCDSGQSRGRPRKGSEMEQPRNGTGGPDGSLKPQSRLVGGPEPLAWPCFRPRAESSAHRA